MCNDTLFGSQCHHGVWLCFVVFVGLMGYIWNSVGRVPVRGGYSVHYSNITQNNNNKKVGAEFKQVFAIPVFYGGAAFSSLLLAGPAGL